MGTTGEQINLGDEESSLLYEKTTMVIRMKEVIELEKSSLWHHILFREC